MKTLDRSRAKPAPRLAIVSVFAAVGLAASDATAFRTAGDLQEFAGTERVRFAGDRIAFDIVSDLPADLDMFSVEQAIMSAASAWSEPECSGVRFDYLGSTSEPALPGDGANTIQWVSDWEERGFEAAAPALADVQYTRSASGPWEIAEADLYLNQNFSWTTSSANGASARDVETVARHEFGHILGLYHPCEPDGADGAPVCMPGESSPFEENVMYPFYSSEQRELSADDVDGVCFLYPAKPCTEAGCRGGQICTDEGCAEPCGAELCAAEQVCTLGGCRVPNGCDGFQCLGLPCQDHFDCALAESCLAGRCASGTHAVGDPCSEHADCRDGACVEGYCARACLSSGECAHGDECESAGPARSACISSLAPLGTSCENAADCLGARCVDGAAETPICSRLCDTADLACPEGWSCETIEGERVCAPDDIQVRGGSCRASPADPASNFWIFSLLLLGGTLRRRHQSRSQDNA